MSSDVEEIKQRCNIVDVVSDYVRLNKTGAYYKARCPFHEEKTPSFVVNEDRQTYHCFGCEAGGDVLSFVMEMEHITFREALKLLADRAGVTLHAYSPEQKKAHDHKARLYELLQQATAFYVQQLWASKDAQQTRQYLADRGLREQTLKKFDVGFAPEGWDRLETFLRAKGYTPEELVQAGLSIAKDRGGQYDRFRHRIMFPIADTLGRTIGFAARVAPGDDETQAKYINTPETPLYHKSNVLYGIHLAKKAISKENRVILVEGNVDVIASHEAGIENVVAVSGTALTQEHVKILKRYTTNFVLFFDADAAGQKAAFRSARTCFAADVTLSLVAIAGGKDAADLVAQGAEKLQTAIGNAQDALTFFINKAKQLYDINDPHGRRQATEYVAELAAVIVHPVERDAWVKNISEAFGTTTTAVEASIQHAITHQSSTQTPTMPTRSQEKTQTPQTAYERVVMEIFMMACAFPDAWRVLVAQASQYPFLAKQPLLQRLCDEGVAVDYDVGILIDKNPSFEKIYKNIARFRDKYKQTHDEQEVPSESILLHLQRAQSLYHKKQLANLTRRIHQADRDGDHKKRQKYLEKLNHLTQKT